MAKLFTKNDPAWEDEVLASDPLYNILQSDNTPINSNVKIELATEVGTAGTSLTAARMNNVETGLDAVDTKLSLLSSLTRTATAAGTTTLTAASNRVQEFTGTTTQTIVMPDVTTLTLGDLFTIVNSSTGILTVNSSGGNLIKSVQPGATCQFVCVAITGTSAASWKTLSFDPAIAIAAAVSKSTPVDADKFGFWDSVSGLLNQVTWANIKATLKTYFDTLYAVIITLVQSTYTPTLTNTTNIDASTAIAVVYSRIGNLVHVSGQVQVDPTAAASTVLGYSLPVASNLATASQCNGLGISNSGLVNVIITGDAANDRATFTFTATGTGNQTITFWFDYLVI